MPVEVLGPRRISIRVSQWEWVEGIKDEGTRSIILSLVRKAGPAVDRKARYLAREDMFAFAKWVLAEGAGDWRVVMPSDEDEPAPDIEEPD